MITFDLSCDHDHRFEGWFRNREDFEEQLARGLVACPLCSSTKVTKRLSAVAVHLARRSAEPQKAPEVEAEKPPQPKQPEGVNPEPFFRALGRFIEHNFDDVGPSFADEARKIDQGEAEARNIRGTTTPQEEEALREDGVEFLKVALPKYDA
jgi:hypothetical protein